MFISLENFKVKVEKESWLYLDTRKATQQADGLTDVWLLSHKQVEYICIYSIELVWIYIYIFVCLFVV